MGFCDIKGIDILCSLEFAKFGRGVLLFGVIMGFFLIAFTIALIIAYKKYQKRTYNITLHFFEEVNKAMIPISDFKACELTIPNTNIKVFYVKGYDLYLPRGTKPMGKKSYWYAIRNNRELINFTLKSINKDLEEAGLDFDHTDMRYAETNLRELINRSYKKKGLKWWQEYKDVITNAIYIIIVTISIMFVLWRVGILIDKLGVLIDTLNTVVKELTVLKSSGVVTAV